MNIINNWIENRIESYTSQIEAMSDDQRDRHLSRVRLWRNRAAAVFITCLASYSIILTTNPDTLMNELIPAVHLGDAFLAICGVTLSTALHNEFLMMSHEVVSEKMEQSTDDRPTGE